MSQFYRKFGNTFVLNNTTSVLPDPVVKVSVRLIVIHTKKRGSVYYVTS